jgi:hypothetical protein
MATKPLKAEVVADRAAAMMEYQQEKRSALERMRAQRAARLAREAEKAEGD